MNKKLLFLFLFTCIAMILHAQNVWINEFHYDNDGADVDEGVEIAGTAGLDVSDWKIIGYDGNNSTQYKTLTIPESTTIPDDGSGYGAIWFDISGLQNGAPDGIALVTAADVVIQFLSYEGSFTAANGPASGVTSDDIGVSELGSATVGTSIQLTGTGSQYSDFSWSSGIVSTHDLVNTGQVFIDDTQPPVATWSPSNGETGIYITSNIVINFDEPVRNIDNSEITDANVAALLTLKLTDVSGAGVAFTASISADKQTITIDPDASLLNNQVYYVGLASVEDGNDNALVAESITFTTIGASVAYVELTNPGSGQVYYAGDNVTISWNSANIATVDIKVYIPDLDAWEVVADDIANDGSEVVPIPTDATYSAAYKIAVIDISNSANADTSDVFTIIGTQSISEIQSNTTDGDITVFLNDIVATSGVVSYIKGSTYYLREGQGPWNGIMVYDGAHSGSLNVGDSISITAKVTEYNNVTELTNVTSVSVLTTGKTVIPTEITTGSYNESYESVFVKFIDAKVTNPDISNGEFEVNDGSGVLVLDDKYYAHSAVLNENITITALGYYSYGAYKVLPRSVLDIVSSSDTVTATEYTVDNAAGTITNIAYTTTLATFKSNITASDSATFNVFDADGTTPATTLDDTKLLIVLAADGITTKTYAITRNAISTVANVTSTVYTVDDGGATITNVPFGTDLATFESNITPPPYGTFETYEPDGSTVATDLQSGYIVKGVAEDGTTTKSYTIAVNAVPLDGDSYAEAPATQVEAGTIVITDADGKDEAVPVFSFNIVDPGTSDGEPTNVSQLVVYYGPNNTMDFETDIDSGYFDVDSTPIDLGGEPVFGTDSVVFPIAADQIVVPDGGSVTVTMNLNLAPHATEGAVIQFMVAADPHGFESLVTGSGFAPAFSGDITGNNLTIDAVATGLLFVQQPTSVFMGDTVKPAVVVAAVDSNGNTDKDYVTDISITSTGADLLYSPHGATPVNGVATFDTLIFSALGTGVTLTATSGALSETSNTFVVAEASNLDLYFSEYVDGSSFNKAIEIFNPTGMEISLNNYFMKGSSNDASDWESDYNFPDTAIIQPYDVFVIVHSSASTEMTDQGDWKTSGYVLGYNGNDARGLFKVVGKDTILLDLLGTPNNPNKLYYEVAGIERAMDGHTIIRKSSINQGNTDWAASAGTNEDNSEWLVLEEDNIEDLGYRSTGKSTETEMLTFKIPGITIDSATKIFSDNDSIAIKVVYSAQLDSLFPVFTLSSGATSVPESGDSVDFSSGKAVFTVTAEDDAHSQIWNVYVVEQLTEILTGNDILTFGVSDQVEEPVIDSEKHIITATVQYGSDLTKLVPTFTISDGAVSNLTSGDTTDFSDTLVVVVKAENGDEKTWKIAVTAEIPTELSIYDIQHTDDASGDSPYTGDLVQISGYVTAFDKSGFFMQDADSAWSGIYVYGGAPAINDSVKVIGRVKEFHNLTEISDVAELVIISSNNTIFAPVEITSQQASLEAYENVLVKLPEVECTNADAGYGMFEVNDGSGAIYIDDVFYTYTPIKGNSYSITGIDYYSYSERKVLPRSANDIVDLGSSTPSNDASLSDLKVNGVSVAGFNAAFMDYNVELDAGTTSIPVVSYVTRDENATVVVENATDLQGDADARTTKVIVTAEDGTTTRTYKVLFNIGGTGLDNVLFSQVSFYPNPVHTRLAITHTDLIESITLLNITGKQISATHVDGRNVVEFDMSDLPGGLYIIQLRSDSKVKNMKFIKE